MRVTARPLRPQTEAGVVVPNSRGWRATSDDSLTEEKECGDDCEPKEDTVQVRDQAPRQGVLRCDGGDKFDGRRQWGAYAGPGCSCFVVRGRRGHWELTTGFAKV